VLVIDSPPFMVGAKATQVKTTLEQTIVETADAAQDGGVRIDVSELPGDMTVKSTFMPATDLSKTAPGFLHFVRLADGTVRGKMRTVNGKDVPAVDGNWEQDFCRDFRFPDRDLKVGDTWTCDYQIDDFDFNSVTGTATYKLAEEKPANGKMRLVILMSLVVEKKGIKSKDDQGRPRTQDLTWKAAAAALWDPEAGELLSRSVHTVIQSTVTEYDDLSRRMTTGTTSTDYIQTMRRVPVPDGA
jgi:hypothetical protein